MNRKISLIAISIVILISACNTEKKEKKLAVKNIKSIENELVSDSTAFISTQKANQLVELYKIYVNKYPADTLSADYLFKAGELTMNLNHSMQAIILLKQFEKEYNSHQKMPYCIFFQAFVYENQMNNLDKAKQYYQQFINDYPEHELADDAETSIKNLGKPLEEIIQGFKESK